ncbi:hypothetical protein FQN57_003926 [Myotisia sp. PD_48]|nr:hypothetical protein FQN57_003926 [Myotisia sp. PD_48]
MTSSTLPGDQVEWTEPIIFPPKTTHTHSMIILHGRGGSGLEVSVGFMGDMSRSQILYDFAAQFPGMKFIFPSAKIRRARFLRQDFPQWFDQIPLAMPIEQRTELYLEGLRDSTRFLQTLVDAEIELVGAGNVIIGGYSQGVAQSLQLLLSYVDERGRGPLGGYFGFSGWLPFQKQLAALVPPGFEYKTPSEEERHRVVMKAINYIREDVLDLPAIAVKDDSVSTAFKTPIWLSHGSLDNIVAPSLGEAAADTMKALGWKVTWKRYNGLEHRFHEAALADVAQFLKEKAGVPQKQ